jgi:hypothetical protein
MDMHLSNAASMVDVMRRFLFLAALLPPVAAVAAVSDAPLPLAALQGLRAGAWQVKVIGDSRSRSHCLTDATLMLTGGRPGQECSFRAITDEPNATTVIYRCATGRSGRTAIRRDAGGLYVVDAQGLEGGHPFADRSEWRRTGDC